MQSVPRSGGQLSSHAYDCLLEMRCSETAVNEMVVMAMYDVGNGDTVKPMSCALSLAGFT